MAKYAEIKYGQPYIVHSDTNSPQSNNSNAQSRLTDPSVANVYYSKYADIYIELRDEFGNLTEGNYATINYQEYISGQPGQIRQITLIGSVTPVQYGALIEQNTAESYFSYSVRLAGVVVESDGTYTPPNICDATIESVFINKKESTAGSKDGQITIVSSSSAGSLQYSLDNINWQPEFVFYNLSGGSYTAYIKDAIDCRDSHSFTLETIRSLLIDEPVVNLGGGNKSRWSAAFNPVVFTYLRCDFYITNIYAGFQLQQTMFTVNGALLNSAASLAASDWVYINAGAYDGVYQVTAVDLFNSTITINETFISSPNKAGFININKLRPYYQVCTKIEYQNKLTGKIDTITCTHRPNQSGITKADISSFLQSLLRAKDDSNFSQINYRDDNLSASYTISYAEVWQDPFTKTDTTPVYVKITNPYYVTFAARQLGDAYGGNMAAYVPFKTVDGASKRARWVTDFVEPAYSPGYPFDIGFIYSEDLAGLNIYYEITPLDINRQPVPDGLQSTYLLNEDSSFLFNQDGSKLVIKRQPIINQPITQSIAQHIGLNRLTINTEFNSQIRYFNIALKYADGSNRTHTITQTQTIRIDNAVDNQSVYLRWIGLTGSWNYYRFVYNQEVTLDVQNAVIVKKHIDDWANQDTMEDVISKNAGVKMKVMAEDLSVADIKGLQSIKYSPKVQMLISKNPVKWQTVVLNTATFAEYETRNGQAPFSVTFNLPGLNIQTQ